MEFERKDAENMGRIESLVCWGFFFFFERPKCRYLKYYSLLAYFS